MESKIKRLTTITGGTGSGKTTFLCQYSLDFAKKGLSTLFCSFELKNEMILSSMLRQYSGVDFEKNPEKFDFYADQFEKIPIYFQSFFGSTESSSIINLIDYALYTYDIGHVVLDNLQFMLSGQGKGFERFELQDDLISKLRNIATEKNVHISLVIHPKKTDDDQDLHISSIFGTSKSTQESDNIFILQNRKGFKVLDIKKNRYDGEIGKAPMIFCKDSKRYYNINKNDIESIYNNEDTKIIIEQKKKLFDDNIEDDDDIVFEGDKEDVFFEKMRNDSVKFGISDRFSVKIIEDIVLDDFEKKERGKNKGEFSERNDVKNEIRDEVEKNKENEISNNFEDEIINDILNFTYNEEKKGDEYNNENNTNKNNYENNTYKNNYENNTNKNNYENNTNKNNYENNTNYNFKEEIKRSENNPNKNNNENNFKEEKQKPIIQKNIQEEPENTFLTAADREIYENTITQNNNKSILDIEEQFTKMEKSDFGRNAEKINIDHNKWNLDKKQNPNFYEEGESITYDDIINEITDTRKFNGGKFQNNYNFDVDEYLDKGKKYKKNNYKKKEDEFFDDYLDYKTGNRN